MKYLLGLYEKSMPGMLDLTEKLQQAKDAGFDYLEMSVDESDEKLSRLEWDDEEVNSLRRAIESVGLPIFSICLSGHRRYPLGDPDPDAQHRSIDIMSKAISLAVRVGVRLIQIAGYDVCYKPSDGRTRKIFAENLRKSVSLASRQGVMLAFETMETPFIDTVAKAAEWVRAIRSPYLQVYTDIGNITNAAARYGTDVLSDMESGRGHLVALHLKETKPDIFREVPYGTGHVDFAAATISAWRLGIRMYVAEFWHVGEDAWRETLRENNSFLRGFLDKASN
jgi:predicted hexulose-6-phosphate isomerase